jgi:hypothetical protein
MKVEKRERSKVGRERERQVIIATGYGLDNRSSIPGWSKRSSSILQLPDWLWHVSTATIAL